MIKVVVVVTGLALVEAPPNGPIDIHLPETEGFLLPALSPKDPNRPETLALDDHDVDLYFGNGEVADPAPFKLEIKANGGAMAQSDLAHFMRLESTLPQELSRVRSDCQFRASQSLTKCSGQGSDGNQKPLLAGQVRLAGNWTVKARNARSSTGRTLSPLDEKGASRVRRLIDDDHHSDDFSNYPKNYTEPTTGQRSISLADAFVFEADVDPSGVNGPADIEKFMNVQPEGDLLSVCGRVPASDCRVLWIENQAPCRLTKDCVRVSTLFEKFDLHLSHAYRLTADYLPLDDQFARDPYVPTGVSHAHTQHEGDVVIFGDGSPRCYGGVIVP